MTRASTWCLGLALALGACGGEDTPQLPEPVAEGFELKRLFPTDGAPGQEFPGCVWASPVMSEGGDLLATATSGTIAALDPETGALRRQIVMPAPEGEDPYVLATPGLMRGAGGEFAVVAYHTVPTPEGETSGPRSHTLLEQRLRHRVAVVSLSDMTLAAGYEPFDLSATATSVDGGEVAFRPSHALARSEIGIAKIAGDTWGRAYVTFGNARDLQPWHGWAFEIDLDAWAAGGEPVSGVLVTTPESDCGPTNAGGSLQRICGGGLWAPTGSLQVPREDGGYDLILAPGNGQLDLERGDFANSLMRTTRGLAFEHGCDAAACADFDADSPAAACLESCQHLFLPRLEPGDELPNPDGRCDGLSGLFACWEEMDYIGGSTPVYVELGEYKLLAYPTKDGAVYLVDYEHLGTMWDREQLVAQCGTGDDTCTAHWAGMIVAQPALAEVEGAPVLVVPTFMYDKSNAAGVVALTVVERDGKPALERRWQFPEADSELATTTFRKHTTNVTIGKVGDEDVAWVVDVKASKGKGVLYGLRVSDGALLAAQELSGGGMRFARPLVDGDRIYLSSCSSDAGPGHVEGYEIVRQ